MHAQKLERAFSGLVVGAINWTIEPAYLRTKELSANETHNICVK